MRSSKVSKLNAVVVILCFLVGCQKVENETLPGFTEVNLGVANLQVESDFVKGAPAYAAPSRTGFDATAGSAYFLLPAEVAERISRVKAVASPYSEISLILSGVFQLPLSQSQQAPDVVTLLATPIEHATTPSWAQAEFGDIRMYRRDRFGYVLARNTSRKPIFLASCVDLLGKESEGPSYCHRQFVVHGILISAGFSKYDAMDAESIESSIKCLMGVWIDQNTQRFGEKRLEPCFR